MRTTLTLDDDVAVQLERLRRARDANLKDLVNEALRLGLSRRRQRSGSRSEQGHSIWARRLSISTMLPKPSPMQKVKATSDLGRR
jgi:hypothetical protein